MNKADKLAKLVKILSWIALVAFSVFGFSLFGAFFVGVFIDDMFTLFSILGIISAASFVIAAICYGLSRKYHREELVAKSEFDSVEEVLNQEAKEDAERDERIQKERRERADAIKAAQHPQCPACKGYNTQRISTTKRVVSTSMVGLASSTIGKQYECKDCLHKW